MKKELTRAGTDGRVYGGDCDLVHIEDGRRGDFGRMVAAFVDSGMRSLSEARGTPAQDKLLCPGCFMIAVFNAAVELAQQNGQPLSELGATMANAFSELARRANEPVPLLTEEIHVILDVDLNTAFL